jgi:hypothetical protein
MKPYFFTGLVLALACASTASADVIVFSNTTTDLLEAQVYSASGYTQIGDILTLGGVARALTDATFQFYNDANAGTFEATLQFWNVVAPDDIGDNPVGAQIGSNYTVTGIEIDSGAEQNVTFTLPNLVVPDTVIATVAIGNLTGGVDPGLENYDPPTIGSSDNTTFVASNGTAFQVIGPQLDGSGNFYVELDAATPSSSTPEPATWMLLAIAAVGAFSAPVRRVLNLRRDGPQATRRSCNPPLHSNAPWRSFSPVTLSRSAFVSALPDAVHYLGVFSWICRLVNVDEIFNLRSLRG